MPKLSTCSRPLLSLSAALALAAPLACGDGPPAASTDTGSGAGTETSSGEQPTTGTPTTTGDSETAGVPACCGCLCVDPGWSCGANTCTPEGGGPVALGPEAGFLAVAQHPISIFVGADELKGTAPPSRLWYAFRPADDAPETRPLAVFFNGGPGASTATLFGFNTGPSTLDPDVVGDAEIAANPHSWTRFANLLYIDPAETGFSYNLALADGTRPKLPFVPEHDAAVMVQALLAFLARHPAIEANPVLLVGESWGGVRAALMGHQLLFPGELVDSPVYRSAQLQAAVIGHHTRVAPGSAPEEPATGARQFGHRVLIQPTIITGSREGSEIPWTTPTEAGELNDCVADYDPFKCNESSGWWTPRFNSMKQRLVRPDILGQALAVELGTIEWMYAAARADAYPRWPLTGSEASDQAALAELFGPLPKDDPYYLSYFIRDALPNAFYEAHPGYARLFVRTLPYVRTFVTHAAKDTVVYSLDLPAQLAWHAELVASAVHDEAPVGDEPRPGRIVVEYQPATGLSSLTHEIRFPRYAASGHMVTVGAAAELLADVEAWYASP